jgi:hypothetical protein
VGDQWRRRGTTGGEGEEAGGRAALALTKRARRALGR